MTGERISCRKLGEYSRCEKAITETGRDSEMRDAMRLTPACKIRRLMHDFSCTDAADMYYGTLADRVSLKRLRNLLAFQLMK